MQGWPARLHLPVDIAAAVSRMLQADALAREAGAALLPTLQGNGSRTYARQSGSTQSGLTNNGRETINHLASISASYQLDFWGGNRDALQAAEETATANRFDRDVTALTTLTAVATAYFNVLASQDRLRTAQSNIASAQRILDAIREDAELAQDAPKPALLYQASRSVSGKLSRNPRA